MAEFQLSNETLRRMMAKMSSSMDKGLEGGSKMSTMAMLPSFVPELPNGTGKIFFCLRKKVFFGKI